MKVSCVCIEGEETAESLREPEGERGTVKGGHTKAQREDREGEIERENSIKREA